MSRTFSQRRNCVSFGDGYEQEERENDGDSFEENIRKQLLKFRSGTDREIILEPMSFDERKIVHYVATNCSLKSHSIGGPGNRRVVVTRFPHVDLCTYTNARDSEPVVLSSFQKLALSQFLTTFPIGYSDIDLYLRSGIATRRMGTGWSANFSRPMLIPPRASGRSTMEHFRKNLPTYAMRKDILEAIRNHKVTMIIGGTGCGKTTQVPQFILEDAAERQQKVRIYCTQPRRLPVLAVSARVAKERNEKLGTVVGYHIRLEQKTSDQTILTYCTSGVLLRLLTNDANACNISHIILDEIHEREQKTDYLLIALRQALRNRSDLKIILMSATMEDSRELFKRYFGPLNVLCLDIPSALHKIEVFYLPEILALTDYKHSSSFTGGTFFGKTARSLNDGYTEQTFTSFPHVDEFRCENYDESKIQAGRSSKKKGKSSRRTVSFAGTNDQLVVDQFSNRQLCPQFSGNACQGSGHLSKRNGESALIEMYNKMNIGSSEQEGYCQEVIYDGYPFSQSQSAMTLSYSQPPPNFAYAQQMPVPTYAVVPAFGGQQLMYATYPVMPFQNDAQNCYSMTHNPQDYMQASKFYLPTEQADAYGMPWNSNAAAYSNQTPPILISSSDVGSGYKNRHYDQGFYVSCLRGRPQHFDPSYVEILRRTNLDTVYLIDSYMISGGEQWSESVDTDLTIAVINYCMDSTVDGSILVFLPGYEDILSVREKVIKMQGCATRPAIFTLHSQMSSQDQQRVFEPVSRGYRKVILSTNIAEASLTIDDVVFVIDCGKVKEKSYDHTTRISQLKMTWIAKSNAEQRAGRAGRCRDGYCFRLFTYEDFSRMSAAQLPEMKRSAIHEVCLHAKMFAPGKASVRQFLLNAPEPPSPVAIDRSLEFLEQIGALFKNRHEASQMSHLSENSYFLNPREQETEPDLTDLGRHIAQLPLDPQLARLLLFGICLKCLSPVLTLVAALSHRDPFVLPPSGEREERNAALTARDIFAGFDYSDHMTLLRAVNAFMHLPSYNQSSFCISNYLSLSAMRMIVGIRQQLFTELQRLRILPSSCHTPEDHNLNRYCNSWPMIQAAIVAGSYPGIGFTRAGGQMRKIRTSNEVASLPYGCAVKRQTVSSAGMNGDGKTGRVEPVIEYLAFQELSKSGDTLSLRTVTAVPPLTVVLFAGPIRLKREILDDYSIGDEFAINDDGDTDSNTEECVFALEPWLVFRWKYEDMQLILKLRVKLMTYFLSMMKQADCCETEEIKELLAIINQVLEEDHRRTGFPECTDLPRSPDDRSVHHRQLPRYSEEQNEREVETSYITSRKYISKQWDDSLNINTRADFCGIQSFVMDEGLHVNDHYSDESVQENVRNSSCSNESVPPSFPVEDEQVPEDPCTSILEEEETANSHRTLTTVEDEFEDSAAGEDSEAIRERDLEETNERRDEHEVIEHTSSKGLRPVRSFFGPHNPRPNSQRIWRIFSRQFVNRSRPQAGRPVDTTEGEESREQRERNEVGRRRGNCNRDINRRATQDYQHERWRGNSPAYKFGAPGAHQMPRAYFRRGAKSDRYHGGSQRGRRASRKEEITC